MESADRLITLRRVRLDDADPAALIEQVQAEYVELYGSPDETPMDGAMFDPPSGALFVADVDGVPAAMGGWRFRADVVALGCSVAAEIKRMYVAPGYRRIGLARRILTHVEFTAREAGADVMVLETGLMQPEAIALYESVGYVAVDPFGFYRCSPQSRYFGRVL